MIFIFIHSLKIRAFTLVSCSAYSSTLKMEAMCSSETSVDFQRTTRRYIPEDSTLHNNRCENLTFYLFSAYVIWTGTKFHNIHTTALVCSALG
jgi:hypothetical protein